MTTTNADLNRTLSELREARKAGEPRMEWVIAIAIILIALALAGCAGPSYERPYVAAADAPSNWSEVVRGHMRSILLDPDSMRDATISAPAPASMVFNGRHPLPLSGSMVCVRANSRNAFGGYTGQKTIGFLFQRGALADVIQEADAASIVQHCGPVVRAFTL